MTFSHKILGFIWAIFYYLLLCDIYESIISVYWGYFGFSLDYSNTRSTLMFGLYVFIIFVLLNSKALDRLSKFFLAVLLLFTIAPIMIYYSYNSAAQTAGINLYLYQFFLIMFGLMLTSRYSSHFRKVSVDSKLVRNVLVMLSIIPFIILILSGGLSNWNINPEQVYEYRDSHSNSVVLTGYLAYLTMWSLVIFCNYLILYYVVKKSYARVSVILVFYFMWYGMTGHKSFMMYPIFSVIVLNILNRRNPVLFLFQVLTPMIAFFYLVDTLILSLPVLTSTFTRRLLFIPANTAFAYQEYFSKEGFLYWSNSFMKSFIDYNYNVNPALLVGSYMGDSTMVANNSFLSTGYMHFGYFGASIYSLMFILLIKSLSVVSREKAIFSENWKIAVLSLPIFQLITSSDFLTTLLTHGLGIGLVLILITRVEKSEDSCYI